MELMEHSLIPFLVEERHPLKQGLKLERSSKKYEIEQLKKDIH